MKPVRVLILICALAVRVRRSISRRPLRSRRRPASALAGPARSTRCTSVRSDPRRCRAASPTSPSTRSNPAIFYVGTAHGGVWKTDQRRHDLRGAVPGSGADVDRRRHRVAEQSRSRLGRHRRVEQPAEHELGRRRLQVDRRRQDLHEHGAQDRRASSTASSSTRATTTSCSSRRPAASSGPAASAASTRPPTAARRGSRR